MSERLKIVLLAGCLLIELVLIGKIAADQLGFGIYCKDYYAVVNKADNKSYEAIIEANGPIMKTEIIDYDYEFKSEQISYEDGRTFVFEIFPSGSKEFCRVDITSDQYRFGRKKVGIGTGRDQIESIYKGGKNRYYEEDDRINVVEANTSINFYFNEQNIVYKISIGEPDIYE